MSGRDSAKTSCVENSGSLESGLDLPVTESNKLSKYLGLTSRQLTFLFTYGLYNIFRGAFVLIIGPFYPPEADEREVSTTVVGFVIGAYDFATFLSSLVYGLFLIPKFGPRNIIIFSAFNTSVCAVLFGCLGWVENKKVFLAFSFVLRLIGGSGDAGFYPSAFAVFACEFPALMSTTVGLFELFFGIGAIFGPIACGPLIDSIGFEWTYIAVGGCLLLCAILILTVSPRPNHRNAVKSLQPEDEKSYAFIKLLQIPEIWFAVLSLFSTAASIGFITGTLETHLDQFQLSSLQVGAVFSVTTGIYTICSPLWGQVSDRLGLNKVIIMASGSLLIVIGFILLAPLDFISKEHLLWGTLTGLCLHGIGIGSAIMVFFPYASETALEKGFPDTIATYGLVSSIFTLTFSLGNAFGPALSGSLYDAVGFKDATLAIIGLSSLVILSAGLLLIYIKRKSHRP
ncbi:MFS-type transporter SLC18B1 [Orchesella cincta]|uniref:MFS-type transporter SLC18B1 n=1 Tax=Orchesella cincta TaxID=48709 RepID=A0A1D2N0X7_ORCCI|nr:MFS-type transporter SLC18B1 [Orchesella cincta]